MLNSKREKKPYMNASALVFAGCLDLVKVVLVELPHKRGKVVVFEVEGQ